MVVVEAGPEITDENVLKAYVNANFFKIRDCKKYSEEYNECKSIKGRIHQNFLDGEYRDCSQWKEDLKNCEKFWEKDDLKAAFNIIQHENERHAKRLKSSSENDVWKKRDNPPSTWNSELPHWLKERQEDAFPESIGFSQYCVIF